MNGYLHGKLLYLIILMSKNQVKQLQSEQWKYYQTWMKEKTICVALGREVKVTRKGWDHITHGTRSKYRSIKDKVNRLKYIKHAKFIIKNAKTAQVRVENGVRAYSLSEALIVNGKKKIIKVILKEDRKNHLVFYSVMQV